ncbi:MAG: DNA repair exonuclease, partial [Proteobacteria bacterium]|nr:DNA repair exonuclease [Pseudomonadota bacterium]
MPAFSFVHTSDIHLDSPFSAYSLDNPELASAMRSATMEAYERIIDLCMKERVDFLLVAGDVYDGADRSLRAQVKFRDGLKRLAEAGIRSFVVHGNHDPLSGWSSSLEWPAGVHIFGDQPEAVQVMREGVSLACIEGISYRERDERRNLALLFERRSPEFHIGLLHANVGSETGHEAYAPCSMEDLQKQGMDYWALGHVHQRRVLSQDPPLIVYPGNPQGRNIRETGAKGCYLVRVGEDKEADIEFRATDVLRWITRELGINELRTEEDLLKALEGICLDVSRSESGRPAIVRVCLNGPGPLYKFLTNPSTLPELLDILQERGMSYTPYVWIERIETKIRPALDLTGLMKGQDFVGKLLRYSREFSADEDFQGLATKELSALFDDPRIRRFIDPPGTERLETLLREAEALCVEGLQGEEG